MRPNRFYAIPLIAGLMILSGGAQARPDGWPNGWGGANRGGSDWGRDAWDAPRGLPDRSRHAPGPVEGHVTVARFTAEGEAARTLGRGTAAVTGAPTGAGVGTRELATYEAAVIDQLAQVGYRTDAPADAATQVAELHIVHDVVTPQEKKRGPVSGEMAVGVSNRGSMVGMAVNVDLTKPRGALIATRLEARIRDKASGAVLWEGRADITTREDDDKWSEGAIAARLAAALFDGFPGTG